MALLTRKQRKLRFKYLGLGEYNKANLLKFQKKAFPSKESEQDSKYGFKTDRALRTFYNVKKFGGGYFKPEEFRCNCGHCSGYPSYMKKTEMLHLAKIRKHYGKPMIITSGLRCAYENDRVGGVSSSGHLTGYAADFHIDGVTDTVGQRVKALEWIKEQRDHEFTYGAYMKDSNGLYRTAKGMGNAMHTETHAHVKTLLELWEDAMKKQFESSKNQRYEFDEHPTVINSKKRGTCITFVAVSLQRLGALSSGGYFYLNPNTMRISGNRASFVRAHPELFKLSYPNKTVKSLLEDGKIKKGDIVGFGNPAYHTMVFMGMSKKGYPLWNTMGHKRGLKVRYKSYETRKINMLVRIKKVR